MPRLPGLVSADLFNIPLLWLARDVQDLPFALVAIVTVFKFFNTAPSYFVFVLSLLIIFLGFVIIQLLASLLYRHALSLTSHRSPGTFSFIHVDTHPFAHFCPAFDPETRHLAPLSFHSGSSAFPSHRQDSFDEKRSLYTRYL